MVRLQKAEIEDFRAQFQGDGLLPDDAGYDEVCQIWNAITDRRPGLCVSIRGAGTTSRAMPSATAV